VYYGPVYYGRADTVTEIDQILVIS